MDNMTDRERSAKIDKVEKFLTTYLHPAPIKAQYSGVFWNAKHMATFIVDNLDEVESHFDSLREEASVQSYEVTKECPF